MSVEEHLKSLRKEQNAIKIENNIKLRILLFRRINYKYWRNG